MKTNKKVTFFTEEQVSKLPLLKKIVRHEMHTVDIIEDDNTSYFILEPINERDGVSMVLKVPNFSRSDFMHLREAHVVIENIKEKVQQGDNNGYTQCL